MHLHRAHQLQAARRARLLATAALAGLTLAGAGLGWAATGETVAAAPGDYRLSMDLSVDGGAPRLQEAVTHGPYRLTGLHNGEGRDCEVELGLAERAGPTVLVQVQLFCDGKLSSQSLMLGKFGEPMTIAVGDGSQRPDGPRVMTKGFRLTVKVDKA
jgi:hypothetical protein